MNEQSQGRIRASDAEREQVVSVLRDAMGEGRLTMGEGEERIAAAYATTYRDQLPELTADLPPAEPARPRRGAGRPGWAPSEPRGGSQGEGGGDRPRAGARLGRGNPVPGLLMLAAVAIGIWAVVAGGMIWPAIVLVVLGLMAAKHGCGARPAESDCPTDDRPAAGH